ncbi:MAG: UbiX family flavin prenyltransferase [Candidatus Thioglobus sp.]|jgi:4-hydroxy-3-polyprenylbenzoate decarboxylase|uniref:flavin prenyltransferase UbiX n=1 Tax=Candidatus Thioglobus sp. TaxID=2026721 RepID=UPI0001BD37D8|nr:flavin prenyltransferase UbiX [Candidatus Thioglobus sp.]EEZ79843.1 MAG: 3-polyprenyl-4-hydroxybenzoate decarboxylase [uncultured Candidatus Thioglobus sp.]MBT3186704.1 UbiX family flavin prenyltransferase [Candidatus Thioglobus sp.]MBT3965149.1 UbiX family flavin prenyltransferase [Candidatus Thioglobus sp.]MBT4553316.1 UbiX family flavin prenyltransferase [Candidatus Thioglobus sp.]MBT5783644.1 UbiX family flavin prenyltransferase [Candidatus Thioglobus sp.]
MKPIAIALTGASGMPYAITLLKELVKTQKKIYVMISTAANTVIAMETDLSLGADTKTIEENLTDYLGAKDGQLEVFSKNQWTAPVASGSNPPRAMVVCPCTMSTLSAIANGHADNLMHRAADVVIKEQKKLILVPRETPYSAIHLDNMLKLSRLGVVIMDANPAFYQNPNSIDDLVNFVVARILDHLDVEHDLAAPWQG